MKSLIGAAAPAPDVPPTPKPLTTSHDPGRVDGMERTFAASATCGAY